MPPPGGARGGTPAPGMETPDPNSGTKTGDKHGASSPAPGESASPKKSRGDANDPSKKALTLKKPQSYHMNKMEIEKETYQGTCSFLPVFFKILCLFHHLSLPSKPTSVHCGCYHPRISCHRSLTETQSRSTNNTSPMLVQP